MGHEKTVTFFLSSALCAFLAFGVTGSVASGFSLAVRSPGTMLTLFALGSCFCSFLWLQKKGGFGILCLMALCAGFLSQPGPARQQILSFLYRISCVYNRAYGWGHLPTPAALAESADIPLALMGIGNILAVSRCLCRKGSSLPPMLTVIIPLALCLVVTNTVPGEAYLFPVFTVSSLLILTATVRQSSRAEGNRLILMLMLPVLTFYLCLFLAIPKEGYVNHSKELLPRFQSLLSRLPEKPDTSLFLTLSEKPELDLSRAGPRSPSQSHVLTVTASFTGDLYLRGQSYDRYTGTGWDSAAVSEIFSPEGDATETVRIHAAVSRNLLYLPYYPAESFLLAEGFVPNSQNLKDYTIPCNPQPVGSGIPLSGTDQQRYTDLPSKTLEGALEILSGVLPENAGQAQTVQAITAWVKNTAQYDLNTPKMPETAEDFALWFLEESDTGYCTHFAAGAVVLLRAAGIPARYVTGYLVPAQAGEPVTVTQSQAHAWAEYYDSAQGLWRVLEATPGYAPEAAEMIPAPPQTPPVPVSPPRSTQDTPLPLPQEKAARWPLLLLLLPVPECLRWIRRKRRKYLLSRGTPNEQALRRWQLVCRFAALLPLPIPEELEQLTLKARFSQHTLTAEELSRYDRWFRSARQKLQTMPWYRRLWNRYRHAI